MSVKTKLTKDQRSDIRTMIREDLAIIKAEVRRQATAAFDEAKKEIQKAHGVKDPRPRLTKLKEDLEVLEAEWHNYQIDYQRKKRLLEAQMEDVKKTSLGALGKPPEGLLLVELRAKNEGYRSDPDYQWNGFKLQNQLDALAAKQLSKSVDIVAILETVEMVEEAVFREMHLCATLEDAKSIYDRFRDLRFEQFGVRLPLRLDQISKSRAFKKLSSKASSKQKQLSA